MSSIFGPSFLLLNFEMFLGWMNPWLLQLGMQDGDETDVMLEVGGGGYGFHQRTRKEKEKKGEDEQMADFSFT